MEGYKTLEEIYDECTKQGIGKIHIRYCGASIDGRGPALLIKHGNILGWMLLDGSQATFKLDDGPDKHLFKRIDDLYAETRANRERLKVIQGEKILPGRPIGNLKLVG